MDSALRRQYSQVFLSSGLERQSASVYAARRTKLLESLSSLCVIAGTPREPGSEEVWFNVLDRRVQDPALLYLTGVNQAGVYLVLDPLARKASERCVLFLPKRNPSREFWDGLRLGVPTESDDSAKEHLKTLQSLTGFERFEAADSLWNWLRARLPSIKRNHCFTFWHESKSPGPHSTKTAHVKDHHYEFKIQLERFLKKTIPNMALRNVAPLHFHQRIPLDLPRQHMIRQASAHTRDAFLEVLKSLQSFKTEHELRAFMDYSLQRRSTEGLAFPTIVAGGANGGTLHYQKCDDPLHPGDLVLLDFGVRSGSVCSDVSRTVPLNGRFDPLQRILYEIVLETQKFHQSQIKPGVLLKEVNAKSWHFLESRLRLRFLSKGGQMRRSYPMPGASHPGPHGISHLIGEQVHEGDSFRAYQEHPLAEGMVISNEPGLYGQFSATIEGVFYSHNLGIRIEDDLLLTRKGCMNLSRDIPKDPSELEKLILS